jgi:hypothetical protein
VVHLCNLPYPLQLLSLGDCFKDVSDAEEPSSDILVFDTVFDGIIHFIHAKDPSDHGVVECGESPLHDAGQAP